MKSIKINHALSEINHALSEKQTKHARLQEQLWALSRIGRLSRFATSWFPTASGLVLALRAVPNSQFLIKNKRI